MEDYFKTEVKDTSALEDLKAKSDLPPNLHINLDYNRFDPATDTFFNGKDAYEKRDTIVGRYENICKYRFYFYADFKYNFIFN